jgi:hypothetical protein
MNVRARVLLKIPIRRQTAGRHGCVAFLNVNLSTKAYDERIFAATFSSAGSSRRAQQQQQQATLIIIALVGRLPYYSLDTESLSFIKASSPYINHERNRPYSGRAMW